MKLSVAWIFDHIEADWKNVDITSLVAHFNQITAEIEGVETLFLDLEPFTLVEVKKIEAEKIIGWSGELNKEFELPARKDATTGAVFLVKKSASRFAWATMEDLHATKGGLLPAFFMDSPQMFNGQWKETCEVADVILEIDNKSITHRPDMWGHRGFAREVAAILELPMVPLEKFIAPRPIIHSEKSGALPGNELSLSVDSSEDCKRIAATYLSAVENKPSIFSVAHRLARVDSKPIAALVDLTNYVMLDIGQPMHAFDAQAVFSHKLMVRRAHGQEKIMLLDGEEISLTNQDVVVSDSKKALGLAGIMGGSSSSVQASTTSLIIESGCFNATVVRRTAARIKKRTEASARFEKTLDPNQTITALERYLHVLAEHHLAFQGGTDIVSVGDIAQPTVLEINHGFLEARIGTKLEAGFIIHVLEKLDFKVVTHLANDEIIYTVTVPTFRATKDISIAEDIVEEIARFFGFLRIVPELPARLVRPFSFSNVTITRQCKELMAYVGLMHEVQNYALYDEEFLKILNFSPEHVLTIKNPVSEHLKHLVTSLIPHLIKNVHTNVEEHEKMRFFEWGRTWYNHAEKVTEARVLAGIIYDKKSSVDFYDMKNMLLTIFSSFGLVATWQKSPASQEPWWAPHQTADIMVGDKRIGRAGNINQLFLHQACDGDAFIFELDADFLLAHVRETQQFIPASKYPAVERDISIRVPGALTADEIAQRIKQTDDKIMTVTLVDFFEKKEWAGERSLTFRFVLESHEKTLTKEEADVVWDSVAAQLRSMGATIR